MISETLSVILSNLPCKYGNVRFTMVPVTVVNRTLPSLHGGLLEITLTVALKKVNLHVHHCSTLYIVQGALEVLI